MPAARGLPSNTPVSAMVAITPARSTEGSAPVSTTKSNTVPNPSEKRQARPRPMAPANARTGASTMATFSPDTTSRWLRPVDWKARVVTGSSLDASPRTRPSSSPSSGGGKIRSIVEPTKALTTWVR